MQKQQYEIVINAPVRKVWHTMLDEETYKQWTKVFDPTSHYEGSWDKDSEIKFLGTNPDGPEEVGMFARIKENRLYEFISIEHLGMINNGVIDTTSDEVKKWTPAFENYTFSEGEGGTKVVVDIDVADEYAEMFDDMWPKALQSLKKLVETGSAEAK